jgi:hypothetical protein
MITFVFVQTLHSLWVLLMEMLLYYSDDSLLHFFLHDMVLSRCINLIEKFFFTLFKCLGSLFLRTFSITLFLMELLLELIVILLSKGFHGKSYLLLKVFSRILRERPSDKLLNWNYILRKRLRL